VKIGVDPSGRTVVQKLLQSVESEISVLKKKLKFPTRKHSMATEIVEVKNEKGKILQQLLQKEEEISKLKQTILSFHNHINAHMCTFVFPSGNEDSSGHISQLNTELQMEKKYRKKAQANLDTATNIIQVTGGEVSKYKMDYKNFDAEIKSLKEKLKGNISLIQAKDIIWNGIIAEMKVIWGFLIVVAEERSIIRDFEEQVMIDK